MRLLIVDDHPMTRLGLMALLRGLDTAIEVEEASSLAAAEELAARDAKFDLILLDMNLPDVSGVAALQRIRAAFESAVISAVSANEDPDFIRAVIDAGAAGYIPKTTDGAVTLNALKLMLARGVYLPSQVLGAGPKANVEPPLRLTGRQLEVLQRLLQAKPNKVIARELGLAEGTVRAHVFAVYAALGLGDQLLLNKRAALMERAHRMGLVAALPALRADG
ncbi:MAG TPA: response regulator transcription factor [Burkholderiaceae bacterium]|nr:response regulator transcription factor [Burkholderiaceae bacterium]